MGLASELYLPTNIKQTAYYANKPKLLFQQNDKYLVGRKTTGAYLALNAINENALHVQSNAIDSYKAVNSNDALLIPILFQYRMSFALIGLRVDGIIIDNYECCCKTFENYFEVLEKACAQ
jgi:hypothetical protein